MIINWFTTVFHCSFILSSLSFFNASRRGKIIHCRRSNLKASAVSLPSKVGQSLLLCNMSSSSAGFHQCMSISSFQPGDLGIGANIEKTGAALFQCNPGFSWQQIKVLSFPFGFHSVELGLVAKNHNLIFSSWLFSHGKNNMLWTDGPKIKYLSEKSIPLFFVSPKNKARVGLLFSTD